MANNFIKILELTTGMESFTCHFLSTVAQFFLFYMHYIRFNEQELPVAIDFAVIKNTSAKLKLTLQEFEAAINDMEKTEVIAYESLKRGHKLENIPFNIKETDIEDILSQESNYADFLRIFSESVLKMFTPSKKN